MSDRKPASEGGLSLQTLLVSSASAVIATLVVSQFWAAGTLYFTALVPVTVAIVSELLKRQAVKITEVAPLVVPRRRSGAPEPGETAVREPVPEEEPAARQAGEDPFGLYAPERRPVLRRRAVRIGLLTGLLAFLIGAAVVTASELALFDNSIGSRDRRTTLVGGSPKKKRDAKATPTPATGRGTPTATPGSTPQATPTPKPGATPTPTPSVSPTAAPSPAAPTPAPASPGAAQSP